MVYIRDCTLLELRRLEFTTRKPQLVLVGWTQNIKKVRPTGAYNISFLNCSHKWLGSTMLKCCTNVNNDQCMNDLKWLISISHLSNVLWIIIACLVRSFARCCLCWQNSVSLTNKFGSFHIVKLQVNLHLFLYKTKIFKILFRYYWALLLDFSI